MRRHWATMIRWWECRIPRRGVVSSCAIIRGRRSTLRGTMCWERMVPRRRVAWPVAALRVRTAHRGVRLRVGIVLVVRTGTHVIYGEGMSMTNKNLPLFKATSKGELPEELRLRIGCKPLLFFALSTRSRILTRDWGRRTSSRHLPAR